MNFQRAAIGFSYMHWNKCRKINFEMRFHKHFIENGLVFVEVLQKDSPLSAEQASLFLTLLQHESDEQQRTTTTAANNDRGETVLSRVLAQLPKLVESMRVFTPSIDVPNAAGGIATETLKSSSLSGSEDQNHQQQQQQQQVHASSSDAAAVFSISAGARSSGVGVGGVNNNILVPIGYVPSPYE